MLNRRLLYSNISPPYNALSVQIEKIDNYLNQTKYLIPVDDTILIYGNLADSEIRVGREITGREQDSYFHEEFSLQDYSSSEFERVLIEAQSINILMEKIKLQKTDHTQFRIKWKLETPHKFEVYFF